MANRYWVGGTASWDGTAGTKWAATSNGPGGETVPTAADDVFFDAFSGVGTVTIAAGNTGAKSINCTGFTGTISGTAAITVSGSITLAAAGLMTYNHTGTVTISNTGTLTTAGNIFSALTINGAGGITVTLGDALNISTRTLTVTQGTFNTANFNVTAGVLASSGSIARTITLGSSTLSLSFGGTALNFATSTNLTFNANTSQISIIGNSPTFAGGGQTFYNVTFTSTSVSSTPTISGANSFNNLTLTGPGTSGIISFSLSANQTITGTLTCAGATALRRVFIRSDTVGTARTLTVATLSANDCDFRDITLAGAASPASPTRAGDCGGNSNITFPAAKTVYRVGTNTTWAGSASWALSSGAGGDNTNFPLPQDTAVINDDTTLTGTLSLDNYNYSALDASARTTGITLNHATVVSRYGSYILGSGVTISGTSEQTFVGRSTMDFNSAGKSITFIIRLDSLGGSLRLLAALTSTTSGFLDNGTINLNGFNLTVLNFRTGTGTKNLTFNGGTLVVTSSGATAFNNAAPTNFTTTAGTGTGKISMTAATAKTFVGGGSTFNCTLSNDGAGALTITGSNTITSLANGVQPTTFTFTAGTTTTITNWNISGTAGNLVTIGSATAASHTLSKASGTVSADYLSISRSTATGGATWYAGANSTDGLNNSGWIFTAAPSTATGNFLALFI